MTERFDGGTKKHLAATLAVTCVTAWFSYAYFHIDEYFQVIEFTRLKLQPEDVVTMPWEHTHAMRSWLQPLVYFVVGRALGVVGVRDIFTLAFVFRLLTGLANVGALALFLRTTLAWQPTDEERRLHLRVVTLTGFLPYLFVRTSSESASMATLTVGFSLLLEGAENGQWTLPSLERPLRVMASGLLLGIAFEIRFQTAFASLGIALWTWRVGNARARDLARLALGFAFALVVGGLSNRWGYGRWAFPAWTYFRANVVEGASGLFGEEPPFAYLWLSPANVFFPVVLLVIACAVLAWVKAPRHPLTWATLPFFLVHNLVSHKEERFLFPIAILSTGLVTLAIGPSSSSRQRARRIAEWIWNHRNAKAIAVANIAPMILLALYPLGWHHNVRFMRALHGRLGEDVHATASVEVELGLPAFHPRVYDVTKATTDLRMLPPKQWLITDDLDPKVSDATTLVYSELPRSRMLIDVVNAYNTHARPPLRTLRFRSLYFTGDP